MQSKIARLEDGEHNTTIKTLNHIAQATNTRHEAHPTFLAGSGRSPAYGERREKSQSVMLSN